MQTLRLVGIHEDGEHLLLADQDGSRFQIPLDDALRNAVRRERPRVAGADDDAEQGPMRPRDVQGLIRTGVPLDEVAERAGWDLDKVRRYEPPIRAERNFIAAQAQALPVRDRSGATTLGERVSQRLTDRGVDAERVGWDSWKETDSSWKVICLFPAGGRERRASWRFSAVDRAIIPADDEARWLGEDEHGSGTGVPAPTVPAPARNAAVYDVEAEGGLGAQVRPRARKAPAAASVVEQDPPPGEEQAVDLVSVMRERAASRRRKPKRTPGPTDTPIATEDMPDDARPVERLDLREDDGPPQGSHADPADIDESSADDVDDPHHDPVTGTRDLFEDLEAVSDSWETRATRPSRRRTRKRGRREAGPPAVAESDVDDDGTAEPTAAVSEDAAPTAELASGSEPTGREPGTETPAAEPSETDETTPSDESDAEATGDSAPEVPDRQRSTRKGRPSVPSWDDIMFGSRRDD